MKRAEEMELIEEMEIRDTEDGGAIITCVLSKDLVHTILTMWMSDAIESETKKVLEKYNGRYEPIKTETPTVAGKDGSAEEVSETGRIYPKREYDYLGCPVYPNDPIADGK